MKSFNLLIASTIAAQLTFTFPSLAEAQIPVRKVRGGYCIGTSAKGNKFVPAIKANSSYSKMPRKNRKFNALKTTCSALLAAKSLKFSNLPATSSILANNTSTSGVGAHAVSGTPPSLPELGSADAASVYFLSDVVTRLAAGTPTESDCQQVFTSSEDGTSGGFSACRSAQNVGEAMGNVLQSETTVCYMKNFPAAASSHSDVAEVTAGELPSGGWRALFDTPDSEDRLVKVIATGMPEEGEAHSRAAEMTMYIKVRSAESNLRGGFQYRAEFYSCDGDSTPQEAQTISINNANSYVIRSVGTDSEGLFSATVSGNVRAEGGVLSFDPDADRQADVAYVSSSGAVRFKNSISIADDQIVSKRYESRDSETMKNYSVASYSGSDMATLRFLSGAFADSFSRTGETFSFRGGVEYRDTGYRSAPSTALVSSLPSDFSDSFFATEPSTPTASTFNCNSAEPSVTLSLNMASDTMRAIQTTCEGNRFESRSFCESAAMNSIQQSFFNHCSR